MAEELSEFQVSAFRDAFNEFDEDGDGFITSRELGKVLASLGRNPTDHELREMMLSADTNDNGTIEFNEFLEVMSKHVVDTDLETDLRMAFKMFDEDDNGLISEEELRKVLTNLHMNYSDAEIERMVAEADLDGDGSISYNEFVLLLTSA